MYLKEKECLSTSWTKLNLNYCSQLYEKATALHMLLVFKNKDTFSYNEISALHLLVLAECFRSGLLIFCSTDSILFFCVNVNSNISFPPSSLVCARITWCHQLSHTDDCSHFSTDFINVYILYLFGDS